MKLINHAKKSFELANNCLSKLDIDAIGNVKGQSGVKNLCLMNNLCSLQDLNYLEIGLFNGLTFCSALYKNKVNAIGIDNWSEFGGSRKTFEENVKRFVGENIVNVIEGDCFAPETGDEVERLTEYKRLIDVYLYDGGHSEDEHYKSLYLYDEFLADEFIFVVDDWQQLEVQKGTLYAIKEMGYSVLWENHCRSVNDDIENWWCGTYMGVLRKK